MNICGDAISHYGRICAVTVTYSDRWHLLRTVIIAARAEGVDEVVVIDNASFLDISTLAKSEFGDFVVTLRQPCNTGSAGGFKAGIELALSRGADFLFLLDDDNEPVPGCLAALCSSYQQVIECGEIAADNLAMLAFRSHFHLDIAMGVPARVAFGRPGSFFGFHLLDIPFKIWRRLPHGKKHLSSRTIPEMIDLDVAPWGGLFFHRSMVERHGLPNPDYVVYTEDYEYTYRVTAAGGKIFLMTRACINELEPSWITKTRFSNSFDAWLMGAGDFRAYYGFRNQTHFETHALPSSIWRLINRFVYMSILHVFARLRGCKSRMRLIDHAFRDGLTGQLGPRSEFPLL